MLGREGLDNTYIVKEQETHKATAQEVTCLMTSSGDTSFFFWGGGIEGENVFL